MASGVVVWSGTRSGYGKVVEIYHGAGYSTRYAHNKRNLVKAGDTVRKGDVIAFALFNERLNEAQTWLTDRGWIRVTEETDDETGADPTEGRP